MAVMSSVARSCMTALAVCILVAFTSGSDSGLQDSADAELAKLTASLSPSSQETQENVDSMEMLTSILEATYEHLKRADLSYLDRKGSPSHESMDRMRVFLRRLFASIRTEKGFNYGEGEMRVEDIASFQVRTKGLLEMQNYVFFMVQSLLGPTSPLSRCLYLCENPPKEVYKMSGTEQPWIPGKKRDVVTFSPLAGYHLFVNLQVIKGAFLTLKKLLREFTVVGTLLLRKGPKEERKALAHTLVKRKKAEKSIEIGIDLLKQSTSNLSSYLAHGKDGTLKNDQVELEGKTYNVIPYLNRSPMKELTGVVEELEGVFLPALKCEKKDLLSCMDAVGCRWDWCAQPYSGAQDTNLDSGRCVPKQYFTIGNECCHIFEPNSPKKLGLSQDFFDEISYGKPSEPIDTKKQNFLKDLCEVQPACMLYYGDCKLTSSVVLLKGKYRTKVDTAFQQVISWFDLGSKLHIMVTEAIQVTVSSGEKEYQNLKKVYEGISKKIMGLKTLVDEIYGEMRHDDDVTEDAGRIDDYFGQLQSALGEARSGLQMLPDFEKLSSWAPVIPSNEPVKSAVMGLKRFGRLTGLLAQQLMSQDCENEDRVFC